MTSKAFLEGLYDLLLTRSQALEDGATIGDLRAHVGDVPADEVPSRLAEALVAQIAGILDDVQGQGREKALRQLDLVNSILLDVRDRLKLEAGSLDAVASPPRVLRGVHPPGPEPPLHPETGLVAPWLFTAGRGSPSLLDELRREIAACDQVDMLVSFITLSGIRKLRDILTSITAVGPQGAARTRLRVLTTTYTGATEIEALDELARLPGCEVKVSLDGRRTRLHAKAWIFHRRTGYGSAYVGSANLSGAALMGGLEWTVKFTENGQAGLFSRARAHFETLWDDTEFQSYDPDNPDHRQALHEALRKESGEEVIGTPTFFDIQPKIYQQEMLDRLHNEREHGRWRNLLVAATGTGKTVVAAFDYRRICQDSGGRPRLLFVAHREEILDQSRRTYREVLRDNEFGEKLSGGRVPERMDHLFATIDSVTSRDLVRRMGPDYWHTVVVDECHRLAADRFQAFVTSVRPHILLGLTATPERSDGKPILGYFDARPDGSPAVEMRLWNALDLQLLAPFEYYACDDETDFSEVPWDQAGERQVIDNLVTGNDVRARLVVNEWRRLAGDPRKSRALVFCVSVAHAEFMADRLNKAGIPAACVVGTTPEAERRRAPHRLDSGQLSAIVTVDLYNEGVDLPRIDTLLLLRPTQSPVLFQQQIGRGLRLAPGKEGCLILDFVGQHRVDFRFDRLFSVITGLSRRNLTEAVETGFGTLPPGCHIHLERQAREQVLRSLRQLTQQNWRRLRTELQTFAALRGRSDIRLAEFLNEQSLDLDDIYRGSGRSGWTSLKRDAGLLTTDAGPEEKYFSRRFGDLLHLDDPDQIHVMSRVAESPAHYDPGPADERVRVQMLAYQVDGQHSQVGSYERFLERLARNPDACSELGEVAGILETRSALAPRRIPGLENVPLVMHAAYRTREILTAVGWLDKDARRPFQAGVLPLKQSKAELLFVTLDKSEGYHDRIAYHDYAITPDRFHWQTQNSAGPDTPAGHRYLESPGNGWQFQLFVRENKQSPYHACGPVTLESSEGNRPMNIYWKLTVPLTLGLFQRFSVLRGQ